MIPGLIVSLSWIAFLIVWTVSAFSAKRNIAGSWYRGWLLRVVLVVIALTIILNTSASGALNDYFNTYHGLLAYPLLSAIGAVLSVLGVALAIWGRVYLGRNWSGYPTLKEGHELVTSGPYARVRHPIYTGMLLALSGTSLVVPQYAVALVVVVALFLWRVGVEERLMLQQFPNQYPEYKKRTWALVPFIF